MARASSSTVLLNLCTFFLLLGLGNCILESTLCTIFNQPIQLYVFRRSPNVTNPTVVVVYPPGADPNGTPAPVGVPTISVSDNPIRRTQSELSPLLGYQRDFRITGLRADDVRKTQVTGVLDLQTRDLNGTITFAGVLTGGDNIPAEEELAVTGGTGLFRAADGYIKSFLVRNSGGMITLRFEVHLCV